MCILAHSVPHINILAVNKSDEGNYHCVAATNKIFNISYNGSTVFTLTIDETTSGIYNNVICNNNYYSYMYNLPYIENNIHMYLIAPITSSSVILMVCIIVRLIVPVISAKSKIVHYSLLLYI